MDLVAGRVWADERRPIRHLDPVLLVATMLLAVAGLLLVYSATNQVAADAAPGPGTFVKKQFTALVLGFVIADRRGRVRLPLLQGVRRLHLRGHDGRTGAGAHPARRGPAGRAALVHVRRLPAHAVGVREDRRWRSWWPRCCRSSGRRAVAAATCCGSSVLGLVPMGLVFIQPDIGTTIVLVAIVVGIVVVAGARATAPGVLALARRRAARAAPSSWADQGVPVATADGVPRPATNARPRLQPQPVGDRDRHGRHRGHGYLKGHADEPELRAGAAHGLHLHGGGEEFGFVGAAFLLLLFAMLLWRAIRIAIPVEGRVRDVPGGRASRRCSPSRCS